MLTLEELKRKPEILQHIDWELNPQEAFEAFGQGLTKIIVHDQHGNGLSFHQFGSGVPAGTTLNMT